MVIICVCVYIDGCGGVCANVAGTSRLAVLFGELILSDFMGNSNISFFEEFIVFNSSCGGCCGPLLM